MENKRLRKFIALLVVAVLLMGTLAACGKDEEKESASDEIALTVALSMEPRSLDPAYNYEYAAYFVVNSIVDSLLYFKEDGSLGERLAESWEVVDPTTYVYKIREGVKFSDGTDLTVDDVIFSLERLRDPELASDVSWMFANVDTIEKTGDWEVTVKLTQPDATWQYVPATPGGQIVSKKSVEEQGDKFGKSDGGVIAAGPYKLDSWKSGSQIVISRNENYWDKDAEIDIDKVTVNIIPEASAIQLALESEQADLTFGSGAKEVLAAYEEADNLHVNTNPSISNAFISFNTQKAPFNDINVRKAVAFAIDSVGIRESQYGDYAIDAGDLPFGEAGYTLGDKESWVQFNKTLPDFSYNIDKAKAALAASAYPDGFKTAIIYRPDPTHHNIAQSIQASLKELNIEVELQQLQASEYYANVYGGQITDGIRDYDLAINLWAPDFPDPAGHLMPQYQSSNAGEGGSNFAAYKNEAVDALIEQQTAITDPDERADLIQQAFAIAAADVPYKYIDYQNNTLILNNKFDYVLSPMWIFNFNYKDVKVTEK